MLIMKVKILLVIGVLLGLFSCRNDDLIKSYQCSIVKSIEQFPDSTFFSKISCMEYHNGKLYILDKKRGDVIWLNGDLTKMGIVSQHGISPDETVMPLKFSVNSDTVYVLDFGSRLLKKYFDGKLVGGFTPSNANDNRFAVTCNSVFLSATTDSSSYLRVDKNNVALQLSGGNVSKGTTERRTITLNQKHIFCSNGFIYTVSGNFPFIDKYDADNGSLVETCDLSNVPIIKEALEYEKTIPYQENSYYIYIMDAYMQNDFLYLLCSSSGKQKKNYTVKTVLKIKVKGGMNAVCTYVLPHDFYSSFCVSDSFLYAMRDVTSCEIEKMLLPDE